MMNGAHGVLDLPCTINHLLVTTRYVSMPIRQRGVQFYGFLMHKEASDKTAHPNPAAASRQRMQRNL